MPQVQETFDGTGAQTDFTFLMDYTSQDFVKVTVDGILQVAGTDYTFFAEKTLRFTTAPASGTDNVVIYRETSTTLLVDLAQGASINDTDIDLISQQLAHITAERPTEAYVLAQVAAATLDPTTPVSAFAATVLDDVSAAAARSTLGSGAVGDNLFTAATASEAQSDMGFPLYGQLLIAALTDAPSARDTLNVKNDVVRPNLALNGDFQVWQHGTSITAATTPANNDDTYTADQWVLLSDGNDRCDVAKEASDVPEGAKAACKLTTAGTQKFALFQPIENAVAGPLSGTDVSLSIDMKATGDLTNFELHLVRMSGGSADVIATDIVSVWGGAEIDPTLAITWSYIAGGSRDIVANSTWQTFTIEGIAVPANTLNLGILLVTDDSAHTAGQDVFVSKVKLERGDLAGPFESRSFPQEMLDCQRFFWKTFQTEQAPVTNVGDAVGAPTIWVPTDSTGQEIATAQIRFPTPMRVTPSMTFYNPYAALNTWGNVGATVSAAAATNSSEGQAGVCVTCASIAASGLLSVHMTADARL